MLTRQKFGQNVNKSKQWILFACATAICYALFNYLCGQFKGQAIPGKCVSSYPFFIAFCCIQAYQTWE